LGEADAERLVDVADPLSAPVLDADRVEFPGNEPGVLRDDDGDGLARPGFSLENQAEVAAGQDGLFPRGGVPEGGAIDGQHRALFDARRRTVSGDGGAQKEGGWSLWGDNGGGRACREGGFSKGGDEDEQETNYADGDLHAFPSRSYITKAITFY
jgi:hypothetical protein